MQTEGPCAFFFASGIGAKALTGVFAAAVSIGLSEIARQARLFFFAAAPQRVFRARSCVIMKPQGRCSVRAVRLRLRGRKIYRKTQAAVFMRCV